MNSDNTKLIYFLQFLDAEAIKELDAFLRSPYFNTNNQLVKLFSYLKKHHPHYEGRKFNKQQIFKHLYPGKRYNDLQLRKLFSGLTKLVEQFLGFVQIGRNINDYNLTMLGGLTTAGSTKYLDNKVFSFEKQLENSPVRDASYYYTRYRLENIRLQYLAHSAQQSQRLRAMNLSDAMNSFDTYYLITKLKFCCEIINYKNIGAVEGDIKLLDELLNHLEQTSYDEVPAIRIYYLILLSLTDNGKEEIFINLKDELAKHTGKFSAEEAREMYIYAQNYCIRKINQGKPEYLIELFEIYKQLLLKKIIFEEGKLSPWDYKNITVTGLRAGEHEWVKQFIEQNKQYLSSEVRKNAYTYNLAKYHFYQEDYDKVLQLLTQVEYNDVFYGLDSKSMLLKTYYELDEIDALDSLADSFKVFLRRKKLISENYRVIYNNFIRFTKKLSRTIPKDEKRLSQIKKELEQVENIADKAWVKEKLEELL